MPTAPRLVATCVALLASCSASGDYVREEPGGRVTREPTPEATCMGCDQPIAVGARLSVSSDFHGWCESRGIIAVSSTCQHVDHTTSLECEGGACGWEPAGPNREFMTLRRTGVIAARLVLRGKFGERYAALPRLVVKTPERAVTICSLSEDGADVYVDLFAGPTMLSGGGPEVTTADGSPCVRDRETEEAIARNRYTCPIADSRPHDLLVRGPGYELTATATCERYAPAW